MDDNLLQPAPKDYVKSKGAMGPTLAALMGIYLTYRTSGEISEADSVILVGAIISSIIGIVGRVTASHSIKLPWE